MKKRIFTGLVAALLVLALALPVFAEGAKEGGACCPRMAHTTHHCYARLVCRWNI